MTFRDIFLRKCYLGAKTCLKQSKNKFLTVTSSKNNFGDGLEVKMAKIHKENFSKGGPLKPKNRDFEEVARVGCNSF